MISDNDSIDFSFFDTEGDHIKLYEGGKHSSSSKIITQAVIESNNSDTKNIVTLCRDNSDNDILTKVHKSVPVDKKYQNAKRKSVDINDKCTLYQFNSISGNIGEALVDKSLFNCLAYNKNTMDDLTKIKNIHVSFEDKEYSSSSSSGSNSTVTTITSDLTSISPLSFLSNSTISGLFEDSTRSSESKHDIQCNDNATDGDKDNNSGINEFHGNEDGSNETSCASSKKYENEANIENSCKFDETDNEEDSNGSINETEQILDDNSFGEEDVEKLEEDSYSETWESGSESGDKAHSNKAQESFQKSYDSNGSDIGSWDLGNEMQNISFAESQVDSPQEQHSHFSLSSSGRILAYRKQGKSTRKKGLNLTFSREELIKIERDNLILLRKIMSQSKPRTVSINQPFGSKKTSTAINRAKHQKQIDQDNYVSRFKIHCLL